MSLVLHVNARIYPILGIYIGTVQVVKINAKRMYASETFIFTCGSLLSRASRNLPSPNILHADLSLAMQSTSLVSPAAYAPLHLPA